MSLITVTQAVYQEDYKIFLQFNNGLSGVVDLEKYLDKKKNEMWSGC